MFENEWNTEVKIKVQFYRLNNKILPSINYSNPWDSFVVPFLISLLLQLHPRVLLHVLKLLLLSFLLLSSSGLFPYLWRRLLGLLIHQGEVEIIWNALIYLVLLNNVTGRFIDINLLRLLVKHVEEILLLLLQLRIHLHLHEFENKRSLRYLPIQQTKYII